MSMNPKLKAVMPITKYIYHSGPIENPPRKFSEGFIEAVVNINKLLKFESMALNTKSSSIMERNVHGTLSA